MKITKDVISDLFPLYAANECSPDTKALIEEYLQSHPREAEEWQRVVGTTVSAMPLPSARLDETRSLREARRQLRLRSCLMGLAIFFSLAPFSFYTDGKRSMWLFLEAPKSALIYGAVGLSFWIAYAVGRARSRSL